jgi:hypothetical protein
VRLPRYDHQVMEPDDTGSSLGKVPALSGWGRLVCAVCDAVGSRPTSVILDLIQDQAFVVGGGSPVLPEERSGCDRSSRSND